jgi:hypothetical protein
MQIPRSLFVVALGLAACGGKKGDDSGGGGSNAGTGKTAQTPDDNQPMGGVKDGKIIGRAGDDVAMLPLDADLIGGVNVQQLQLGGLWKDFVIPMIAKDPKKLEDFKTKCGFDPLATVKSASFGIKNIDTSGNFPDSVFVVHGITKAQGLACLEKMKADIGHNIVVTVDGDYVSFTRDSYATVATWTNDNTLLIEAPHGSKDDLVKLAKGDDTLRSSPQVVDMFGKLNMSDSVWFLLKGSAKIVEKASAVGLAPVAVFGTVNAGNDLAADIRVRAADAAEAKKAQGTLSSLAMTAKGFAPIDKIDAVQDGNDVRVQASITGEHIRQAQATLSGKPAAGSAAAPAPAAP